MKMHRFVLGLAAAALMAQTTPDPVRPAVERAAGVAAVKAYLGLSDQQVEQLLQLRRDEEQYLQPIREQIRAKAEELRIVMQQARPDPTVVGRLVIALRDLRNQVADTNAAYHQKALAVLDSGQKAKLEALKQAPERAVSTRLVIAGARILNLLPPPARREAAAALPSAAGNAARQGLGLGLGLGRRP